MAANDQEPAPIVLEQALAAIKLPGEGSEAFVAPAAKEQEAFTSAMENLFAGDTDRALPLFWWVHYEVYQDATPPGTAPERRFLLVREGRAPYRGQGIFVVNYRYRRNLVIEVPHPLFDTGTLEEGIRLLRETGARALFIAGAHRCANQAATPCNAGHTRACGGVYRISDAGHYTDSFFQAAHRAAMRLADPPIALSLHSFLQDRGDPAAVLSDGTRESAAPAALVSRLRADLEQQGVVLQSCNRPEDGKPAHLLCGTSNVQGRLSNGAANACHLQATRPSGLFLHLEQGRELLADPAPLIKSLQRLLPERSG